MNEHTPGPWHWSISPRFKDIRLDNTAGLVVMDFARWGMQGAQPRFRGILDIMFETSDLIGDTDGWPHPDARLIAAAPELLEALQYFVGAFDAGDTLDEAIMKARAAIEKATKQ